MQRNILIKNLILFLWYTGLLLFSIWLMVGTFGYDQSNHTIKISSRLWSDFGAHLPLIRSFSYGKNWPPEYAIFPGEKIRYHFLFYAIAGILEKTGIRLDWAVNIPSIIGFFLLLVVIYKFTNKLFQNKTVSVISVLFFLFNGTFSFLYFLQNKTFESNLLLSIWNIKQFPSFGPWDGKLVSAFGNLNVYTNQRHLALSFVISLFLFYICSKYKQTIEETTKKISTKQSVILSLVVFACISLLLFMNQATLLPTVLGICCLWLFAPTIRKPLLLGSLLSLLTLFFFQQLSQPSGTPTLEFGYLSPKPVTLTSFTKFWIFNLGLHSILIPLGILIAPKRTHWLSLFLIILFIIPNIFRLSPDMINNHKLINYFSILGNMYSAYIFVEICKSAYFFSKKHIKNKIKYSIYFFITILCTSCMFIILIFSGVLDLFVIKNDHILLQPDIKNNQDIAWFYTHTPPNSVILNSTWFYHPASLAGRKIYNGYSFFTWSAGYNSAQREQIVKSIYQTNKKQTACTLLHQENIDYVEIQSQPESFLQPISPLWNEFIPLYINEQNELRVFKVNTICE